MASAVSKLTPDPDERRNVHYTIEDLVLDVQGSSDVDLDVIEGLTSATLSLDIDQASTVKLGIEDPELAILNGGTLTRWAWGQTGAGDEESWVRKGQAVDFHLDDLWFRLVTVEKQAPTTLLLTAEDRLVALLREQEGPKTSSRAKTTRAQFILGLANVIKRFGGIPTWIPALTAKQKIAKYSDSISDKKRRTSGHPGFASGVKLEGLAGHTLSSSELNNAQRALDVAGSHKAGKRATLALLEACIVEAPNFDNPNSGDASSVGILQLLDSHLNGSTSTHGGRRDIELVCSLFLTEGFTDGVGAIQAAKDNPDWTPGQIAQHCQGSAFPARYEDHREAAEAILKAYSGGGGTEGSSEFTKSYHFTVAKHETFWDAIQRLANEVRWRAFVRQGRLWYVSDTELFAQRAEMTLVEGEGGCDAIEFEIDLGARDLVAEVTVTARAELWSALPGMVVIIKGQGPADGRWLVSQVELDLLDETGACTITLRKPLPAKKEPAPDKGTKTSTTQITQPGIPGETQTAEAVYSAAFTMDQMNLPYRFGGGHDVASFNNPGGIRDNHGINPTLIGMDCSGSVCWALRKAGMFPHDVAIVSGDFNTWGKAGKGKYMTIWYSADHVWIEFNIPGKRAWRFDTSPHGDGPNGPHLRVSQRSTAGFSPRHWPGT